VVGSHKRGRADPLETIRPLNSTMGDVSVENMCQEQDIKPRAPDPGRNFERWPGGSVFEAGRWDRSKRRLE
jgi:hypothetical protein